MFSLVFGAVAVAFAGLTSAQNTSTFTVNNACNVTIAPAFAPATDSPSNSSQGFSLDAGSSQQVEVPYNWTGRAWARTGCDDSGSCASGQCDGGLVCNGYGANDATLLQLTTNGYANQDYLNPTAQDGFNVPLSVAGCNQNLTCSSAGDTGNGCGSTSTCPTGTSYTLTFC